jgi:hypothetical protein
MRKEVTGGWGIFHGAEVHKLCFSSDLIGVIK